MVLKLDSGIYASPLFFLGFTPFPLASPPPISVSSDSASLVEKKHKPVMNFKMLFQGDYWRQTNPMVLLGIPTLHNGVRLHPKFWHLHTSTLS